MTLYLTIMKSNYEMQNRMPKSDEMQKKVRFLQDMLAFTGHEWRNQLTALLLSVNSIQADDQGQLTEKQTQALKGCRQSLGQMRQVADRFITAAHLGNPDLELKYRLIEPVEELLTPLCDKYQPILSETNTELDIMQLTLNTPVWADGHLLYSVLDNLISNAIKYGHPQNGKIVIELVGRGTKTQISVWNKGRGIPREDLDVVFEPYYRGGSNQTEGDGIGLYLAKTIIDAHGGYVWAESLPGSWAKFTFTLPNHGSGLVIRR